MKKFKVTVWRYRKMVMGTTLEIEAYNGLAATKIAEETAAAMADNEFPDQYGRGDFDDVVYDVDEIEKAG